MLASNLCLISDTVSEAEAATVSVLPVIDRTKSCMPPGGASDPWSSEKTPETPTEVMLESNGRKAVTAPTLRLPAARSAMLARLNPSALTG